MDKEIKFEVDTGMTTICWEIASTLLSYKDDMTDLCVACGEVTSKLAINIQLDEWIECTRQDCGRWYHLHCVGRLQVEGDYICFVCTKD
ncbi:hypothetical protein SKAU_G00021320 [Synaphobranchus kaupii]|uniref:Zinc finger PHD-type domain-containing protein n=1 Tax=Synaphobranchus kaupii TaxID=118154 RepID=A0A9Q1GD90_SYNKA|nr:hypothetical protein SKAU_G00021320 [Synaphobranchus kaupii]